MGSECTRPSVWAPGRAAKMHRRRQQLTFSRKKSYVDTWRPTLSRLFSGHRIAPDILNAFLDSLSNVQSGKNIPVANEFTDFEKSSVEHPSGHQKVGANTWRIFPDERITLERQALRVTSDDHHGSECTRPSAWAPGRAAKMHKRRQQLTFSRKNRMSTPGGQLHIGYSQATELLQIYWMHFWIAY